MGSRRRGLGLVEVVTGTGLLLVMTAIQVPAVQQARDRARSSQCVNNLKQLGLACHNYESTWGCLPMSAVEGKGRGVTHGTFVSLLPFMEQVAAYNSYNFSVESWDPANSTTVAVKIETFLCPANPNVEPIKAVDVRTHKGKSYPGESTFAASHYASNWGGVRKASGDEAFQAYKGSHLGVLLTVVDPYAPQPTRNITLVDVKDGTSNTILMAERRGSSGWLVSGWCGTEFDVNVTPSYTGSAPIASKAFTGSHHPEGATLILMSDGAVKKIAPSIDRALWYALTTRAGREPVNLDALDRP